MGGGNVASRIVWRHKFQFVSVSVSLQAAMDWRFVLLCLALVVFSCYDVCFGNSGDSVEGRVSDAPIIRCESRTRGSRAVAVNITVYDLHKQILQF